MCAAVATALDYKRLIAEIPPKVIRARKEAKFYLDKVSEMTLRWKTLSPAERDLYDTLKLLVEEFEKRTYHIPAATPIEVIQSLMTANGLKQKDLVGVFESASVVSEVLSGKRELTKQHIRRLSHRFHVSPELFL
jgi:HTH-type transcriptional regulator / antitoxin HigA